ncbi:beta-methylmalyl-CoA/L-malyl-CoA lyase [Tamaricihabitans halophyticus]|uniref:Beta-methylmalyl-CoA/L-malyl-CoA lyase n=1 Tax=Tamaricihabitans halophyticus TaxID=1262583 RepID=A0A4R2QDP2_9PSEU|nr:CoA ester lyase [Tamaricihabitans halophyticus]TCP45045.1 beta-methylmalyl-CoA/L-malyl-CoA lyase [Tamaricihabitans halophyticus]
MTDSGTVVQPRSRLRRSELSTPATSMRMIAKAAGSNADLVFLDLEDSVAPSEKVAARSNVGAALNELDWSGKTRACRVNGVQTQWCHGDIIDVVTTAGENLDVIIIPKVRYPRDIWFADDLLTQLEASLGLAPGRIGLEVLIEETEALSCVEQIAAASPRLEALILGVGDLSASQGMRTSHIGGSDSGAHAYPGDRWHYARNRMIVAARAHGIDAIDGPFAGIGDPEGYRREASWATGLGAVGKWCIHPSQIEIANQVFAPTSEEIETAEGVIAAMAEAEAQGQGAAKHNGMMVDIASVRIHEAVLDRADLCGLRKC